MSTFDESKHERYPKGDSRGGKFAPKSRIGDELQSKIDSGSLDIPKDVVKRRFTVQSHDDKMIAYSDKVWEEIKLEMKRQGLSDADIKEVESSFYALLSDNRSPKAKMLTAALMMEKGMSKEAAMKLMQEELMKRGGFYGAIFDYKSNFNTNNEDIDTFIMSEHGFEFYKKYDSFHSKSMTFEEYTAQMNEKNRFDYKNLFSKIENIEEVYKDIETDLLPLGGDSFSKGVSIVSEVSQKLYERNAESDTYYRGIYDLAYGRHSAFDYSEFKGTSPSWPVKSINNAFSSPDVSSVEVPGDVLVAWAPSKQIAKSFSAGGGIGDKDAIMGKAIMATTISSSDVAFYWPAIYSNIGSSIDTKEVWVMNEDGTYEISREQWEQLK